METLSKYYLKIVYTCDIEDHADGYCSDYAYEDLDIVHNVHNTNMIRLYYCRNKYITEKYYNYYLMHDPGYNIPDSGLIEISCDDLMNDTLVSYFTNYYTEYGCSTDGSGACEARGTFNVSIELLSHGE